MGQAPDPWFFYALCLLLVSALIWVVVRYIGKIDTYIASSQETIQEFKIMIKLHDQKLIDHDHAIGDLKQKVFTINYKK